MQDSTREVATKFAAVSKDNAIMVFSNAVAYNGSWKARDCAKALAKDETAKELSCLQMDHALFVCQTGCWRGTSRWLRRARKEDLAD